MPRAQNSTHTLNYLASIHYATQVEDLGSLCRMLKSQHDLSGMMIQQIQFDGRSFSNPSCRCFGSYVNFRGEYFDDELYTDDALLSAGLEYGVEFNWDKASALDTNFARSKEIRLRLRQAGMLSGISSVQRSSGMRNTVIAVHMASSNEYLSDEQARVYEEIAPYLLRLSECDWLSDGPIISLRQLSIAQQLKDGMSQRQTANELRIPLRAVKFHINRINDSLNVEGIEQAIELLEAHCVF